MANCAGNEDLLYSDLAADPDLADLVELFVEELPGRIAALRRAFAEGRAEEARRLAHQLKGACGSYGFPEIGGPAWQLEQAARTEKSLPTAPAFLDELAEVCRRVRAGVPS